MFSVRKFIDSKIISSRTRICDDEKYQINFNLERLPHSHIYMKLKYLSYGDLKNLV